MQLPDLQGKVYIVTGANAGLGFETTRYLAAANATVVMACRTPGKAQAAADQLRKELPHARLEQVQIDLADYASVRRAAAEILQRFKKIDCLVNNAGLFFDTRKLNDAGHEMTIATNHLGPFLLTNLLLPRLRATPGARVVSVSSEAHRMGKLRLDDLHGEKSWGAWQSYGTSKLANIVFTRELARRLEGSGVTATCCHPGFVASNFGETNGTLWDRLIGISKIFAISPPKGALTQTWLAASPEVAGQTGGYYASRKLRTPTVQGRDDAVARELWSLSEKLVGLA